MADLYNVDRLRTLHAVWLCGSLTAAAEKLHITPSAVSQQLSKLERETDAKLLVPQGRGVRPTVAGDLLARRVDRILSELHAARQDLDSLVGDAVGPVKVGAIPSAVHTFVPKALTDLVSRCGGIEPGLCEVEPEQGLPMLSAGALDVVVVESWQNMPLSRTPETAWTELMDDTACVVLPHDHPRAQDHSVEVAQLTNDEVGLGDGDGRDPGAGGHAVAVRGRVERGLFGVVDEEPHPPRTADAAAAGAAMSRPACQDGALEARRAEDGAVGVGAVLGLVHAPSTPRPPAYGFSRGPSVRARSPARSRSGPIGPHLAPTVTDQSSSKYDD